MVFGTKVASLSFFRTCWKTLSLLEPAVSQWPSCCRAKAERHTQRAQLRSSHTPSQSGAVCEPRSRRSDLDEQRAPNVLGLGLYICREIFATHPRTRGGTDRAVDGWRQSSWPSCSGGRTTWRTSSNLDHAATRTGPATRSACRAASTAAACQGSPAEQDGLRRGQAGMPPSRELSRDARLRFRGSKRAALGR